MHALAGIQHRTLLSNNTFYAAGNYSPWEDVPENIKLEFKAGTQFRIKPPQWTAKVTVGNLSAVTYTDDQALAEDIETLLSQAVKDTITIQNITAKPVEISERKLQFRSHLGRDIWSAWITLTGLHSLPEANALQFRIRPDYEYKVKTGNNIGFASIDFDDIELLLKHIDRMLRENTIDSLDVKRVPYAR